MIYITVYFFITFMLMVLLFQTYPQLKKEFENHPNGENIILTVIFVASLFWMITIPYIIAVMFFESKGSK